jgi:uncharacterized membrane protein
MTYLVPFSEVFNYTIISALIGLFNPVCVIIINVISYIMRLGEKIINV